MDKEAIRSWVADCWNSAYKLGLIHSKHEFVLQVFKVDPNSIGGKADAGYASMKKDQLDIPITFVDASKEDVVMITPERRNA